MDRLIEFVESKGLYTPELVKRFVSRQPLKELVQVRDELYSVLEVKEREVRTESDDPLSFYNFLASTSLRGDHGCKAWGCRVGKARLLARYSALYADQVVLPLWIEPGEASPDEDQVRQIFGGGLLSLLEMRQVIEAGIIKPVRRELGFCEDHQHHFTHLTPEIEAACEELTQEFAHSFSCQYFTGAGTERPLPAN